MSEEWTTIEPVGTPVGTDGEPLLGLATANGRIFAWKAHSIYEGRCFMGSPTDRWEWTQIWPVKS